MLTNFIKYINTETELNLNFEFSQLDGTSNVLSIIRIEEEAALKNTPNNKLVGPNYKLRNPKIYLNYLLMFSSGNISLSEAYKTIDSVVKYFQHNSQIPFNGKTYPDIKFDAVYRLELMSPSVELISQIWAMNGGKQQPAVFYKMRVRALEKDEDNATKPAIKEIGALIEGGGIVSNIYHKYELHIQTEVETATNGSETIDITSSCDLGTNNPNVLIHKKQNEFYVMIKEGVNEIEMTAIKANQKISENKIIKIDTSAQLEIINNSPTNKLVLTEKE